MNLQYRAAAAVVALFASAALAAAQPTTAGRVELAQTLVLPFHGVALGLNDYGDVVGHSDYRAFLWTADWGFVDLGTLPGLPLCQAAAVNNRRQVVGWCWGGPVNGPRAFLWTAQRGMRDIGDGAAFAINDLREIVGGGGLPGLAHDSWRWVGGRRQLLGVPGTESMALAINEWGHITLSGPDPSSIHIFVWRDGTGLEDLGVIGIGMDMNDRGDISTSASSWNPTLLRPGQAPEDIVMPAGKYGTANGVNDMSVVVGAATDNETENLFAFMWTDRDGYAEIGGAQSRAEKINTVGEVAGSITGEDGQTYPAVWRLRTPVDLRLNAAAAVLRAHMGRGLVDSGPGRGLLRHMDQTARAARNGAQPAELCRQLRALKSQVHGLLRAGHLPAFESWIVRTIEFAAADLTADH